MQSTFERFDVSLISVAFAIAMLASWFLGYRRGRKMPEASANDPDTKFIDASVVLLGLLLAFTFSIALQGHDQRRGAVVAESNAISDFYTCASLLKEPARTRLQGVVRDYAHELLGTRYEEMTEEQEKAQVERCQQLCSRMTEIVSQANAEGTPIAVALANTLNNMSSTYALRLAAYKVRTPWSIVTLLFVSAVVPAFLIGEKQGVRKVYLSGSVSFVILVTAVIFVTLDLDQPHSGIIRVSRESLERVVQSMGK
jgi:hypothetical protein